MTTFECCICYENVSINKLYLTVCIHKFCNGCFSSWKQTCKDKITCPVCRTNLNDEKKEDAFSDLYEGRINFVDWQVQNLNTFPQDFYFKYISSSNEDDSDEPDDSDKSEDYEMEEGDDWDEIEEWQRRNYYGEEYV